MYFRQEIREEKIYREAMRKRSVVPFFHPENIPLYEVLYSLNIILKDSQSIFLCAVYKNTKHRFWFSQSLLQQQIPDMRSLSMALPPFPKSDSTEGFLKDAPQEDSKL